MSSVDGTPFSGPPNMGASIVTLSNLGTGLTSILMSDDIQVGSSPSYELCKLIYLFHPLGMKMAETPINIAMSQGRERVVQDAPDEVIDEFEQAWKDIHADYYIQDLMRLARVYGIASLVVNVEGMAANDPLKLDGIWGKKVWFTVLDPLNTAGSLVLNQNPTDYSFNRPVTVRTNGEVFHPTKFCVMMNENPVYIAYTSSAFGFVGRSVYQRALFPLKSFVRSMMANDMIQTKLGVLIAKQKSPGSIIDKVSGMMTAIKRAFVQEAQTGQVLTIDVTEDIQTLNMMNVDAAGTYSRTNIIKDIASAAEMPAKLLDNETLVSGFGEGSEDAKNIAKYIDKVRKDMEPPYEFIERVVMHRAWNPDFYTLIQQKYPDTYSDRSYEDVFSEWRDNYEAKWPSLLVEPPSETIKVEETKLQAVVAYLQTLIPELDPENKARAIQWGMDNLAENKQLFPHELELDIDTLTDYIETQADKAEQQQDQPVASGAEAKKFGRMGGG